MLTTVVVALGAVAVAGAASGLGDDDVAGPPPPSSPSSAYSSHLVVVIGPPRAQAQAHELWRNRGPADYRFVWWTSAMIGTSRTVVEVRGGRPTVDSPQGPPGTVEEAFARVDAAEREAARVTVDYDLALGYPHAVRVDEIANAVDDEHSFGIESLQPL